MSDDNVFELFGEADENDETQDEADPGVVAFLDQQSAEFNAKAEHEFADRYGFVHKCRCDQDYSSGNTVEVTECYANMTLEALDACAALHAENTMLRKLIQMSLGGTLGNALAQGSDPDVSDSVEDESLGAGPEADPS